MNARKPMTPARMRRIWEREKGVCWFCTKSVPMRGGDLVRYDHRIPVEISQDDSDAGIYPIHREPCDRLKTAADQAKIAKVRRMGGEKGQAARRAKNGSRLKSGGFQKDLTKGFDGKVRPAKSPRTATHTGDRHEV